MLRIDMMSRRMFGAGLAAALLLTAGLDQVVAQGKYPSRPVTIVLPFGAGGVGDVTARLVAGELSKRLGQPFVIDNRPGAGGIVAARAVANAKPDGYTLGLVANGTAISAAMFKSLPVDPVTQFEMISLLGTFELVVVTGAESPYKSLRDFVTAAKSKPGSLDIGTIAIGSGQHFTAELLKVSASIEAEIVPHKASGDVMASLLRKDIDVVVEIPAAIRGLLADKKIRVLATTGSKRSEIAELADSPTAQEQGVAGLEVVSWNGLYAPVGTSKDVIETVNAAMREILADPAIRKRYLELGVQAEASSPEELKTKLVSDIEKWTDVMQRAGIAKQ